MESRYHALVNLIRGRSAAGESVSDLIAELQSLRPQLQAERAARAAVPTAPPQAAIPYPHQPPPVLQGVPVAPPGQIVLQRPTSAGPSQPQQQSQERAEEPEPDNDDEEDAAETYSSYSAKKIRELYPNVLPHPDPLVETASLASVQLPDLDPTQQHHTLQDDIDAGRLSDAQIESIIYAWSKFTGPRLPDGKRRGFFLGDGAGVGKGRTIAGLVKQHWNAGGRYILWVSVSQDLRQDARRDLQDINAQYIQVYEPTQKQPVPEFDFKGVVFVTYSLLRTGLPAMKKPKRGRGRGNGRGGAARVAQLIDQEATNAGGSTSGMSSGGSENGDLEDGDEEDSNGGSSFEITDLPRTARLAQIIRWLERGGENGALIILDESHRAKNLIPEKGGTTTQTARAIVHMQEELPDAKVLYSSATGASEPRNMAYMTRLWGTDQTTEMIKLLGEAKLGALELAAMSLKATGSYLARTLSYAGADFDLARVEVSPAFEIMYDRATKYWTLLFHVMSQVAHVKHWKAQFWGAHQRFFRSMLMAAKVPHCAYLALKAVEEGMAVVIGLQSTGEAATDNLKDQLNDTDGEFGDLVSAPRQILDGFLRNNFPTMHPNAYYLENDGTLEYLEYQVWQCTTQWKDMMPINELVGAASGGSAGGGSGSADGGNLVESHAPEVEARLIGADLTNVRALDEGERADLERIKVEELEQQHGRIIASRLKDLRKATASVRRNRDAAKVALRRAKEYADRLEAFLANAEGRSAAPASRLPTDFVILEDSDVEMEDNGAAVAGPSSRRVMIIEESPPSSPDRPRSAGGVAAKAAPAARAAPAIVQNDSDFIDLTGDSDEEAPVVVQKQQPAVQIKKEPAAAVAAGKVQNQRRPSSVAALRPCVICQGAADVATASCMVCQDSYHAACLGEWQVPLNFTCDPCKLRGPAAKPGDAEKAALEARKKASNGPGDVEMDGVRIKAEPGLQNVKIKREPGAGVRAEPAARVLNDSDDDFVQQDDFVLTDAALARKTPAQLRMLLKSAVAKVEEAEDELSGLESRLERALDAEKNVSVNDLQSSGSNGDAIRRKTSNTLPRRSKNGRKRDAEAAASAAAAAAAATPAAAAPADLGPASLQPGAVIVSHAPIGSPIRQPAVKKSYIPVNEVEMALGGSAATAVKARPEFDLAIPDQYDAEASAAAALAMASQENARLVQMRKWLLHVANYSMELPANPLDQLIERCGGASKVAELTGRKGYVGKDEDGNARYINRSNNEGPSKELNLREKDKFMSGTKRIAIISDAASTGISLQADRRVSSRNYRRFHLTLELPWSADKAIQQFGRSHRANQLSAPSYKILVTPCGGEFRFASAAAKRLASLGALLRGDRNAIGAGTELRAFDVDTAAGYEALNHVMKTFTAEGQPLPGVKIPELPASINPTLVEQANQAANGPDRNPLASPFFVHFRHRLEQLGLLEAVGQRASAGFSAQLSYILPRGRVKIPQFLNRLLGLPIAEQDLLFKYFADMLDATISKLKSEGKYDVGIVSLTGRSITLKERTVVHQNESGGTVEHVVLQLDQGLSFDEAVALMEESTARIQAINRHNRQQLSGFYIQSRATYPLHGVRRNYILLATEVADTNAAEGRTALIRLRCRRPYGAERPWVPTVADLQETGYRKINNLEEARAIWDDWFNYCEEHCMHGDNCRRFEGNCTMGVRHNERHLLCGAVLEHWQRLGRLHDRGGYAKKVTKRAKVWNNITKSWDNEEIQLPEPLIVRRALTKAPGQEEEGDPIVGICATSAEEAQFLCDNLVMPADPNEDILVRLMGSNYRDPNGVRGLEGGADPFIRRGGGRGNGRGGGGASGSGQPRVKRSRQFR